MTNQGEGQPSPQIERDKIMEKQNYNGKTALLVSYQFRTSIYDGQDIVLINTDFPTYEQALKGMKKIMPDGYEYDDGTILKNGTPKSKKGRITYSSSSTHSWMNATTFSQPYHL
jgi:hypothetical protein